jgi:hypothetical protein
MLPCSMIPHLLAVICLDLEVQGRRGCLAQLPGRTPGIGHGDPGAPVAALDFYRLYGATTASVLKALQAGGQMQGVRPACL